MILLSWAGRFFLPLVAMETFLKAAIWKPVKAAKEWPRHQLPCCCHRGTGRQTSENQDQHKQL